MVETPYNAPGGATETLSASSMNPELFMRNWQAAGMRMLRAQERMLHGMMRAAKLEMQFGQELMSNRMTLLQPTSSAQAATERAVQSIERMMEMMRAVTEELRSGFAEATKLMTEGASAEIQEAAGKATEVMEQSARRAEDMMQATAQHGADVSRDAAARTDDAVEKAKELSPGYGEAHNND